VRLSEVSVGVVRNHRPVPKADGAYSIAGLLDWAQYSRPHGMHETNGQHAPQPLPVITIVEALDQLRHIHQWPVRTHRHIRNDSKGRSSSGWPAW
jgi:hypothetical protein